MGRFQHKQDILAMRLALKRTAEVEAEIERLRVMVGAALKRTTEVEQEIVCLRAAHEQEIAHLRTTTGSALKRTAEVEEEIERLQADVTVKSKSYGRYMTLAEMKTRLSSSGNKSKTFCSLLCNILPFPNSDINNAFAKVLRTDKYTGPLLQHEISTNFWPVLGDKENTKLENAFKILKLLDEKRN